MSINPISLDSKTVRATLCSGLLAFVVGVLISVFGKNVVEISILGAFELSLTVMGVTWLFFHVKYQTN